MVNVLVIGAYGYVGEPLSLELRRQGHTVYGLVRNAEKAKALVKGEVNVVVSDGTKSETFAEIVKQVDVIVNTSLDFSNLDLDIPSVIAISDAIEKAGGNKKKVIFMSGFLGCAPSDAPLTEDSPLLSDNQINNLSPEMPQFQTYVRNRLEAERRVLASKLFYGVVAKPPFIYGGLNAYGTIHFQNAEEGKVVVYGGGNLVFSYLHIDDVVGSLIAIINADASKVEHQVFLFGEPDRLTQKEIAYALARGTGKDIKELKEENAPFERALYGRGHLFVDGSKAKNVLGWTPTRNLARDAKVLYHSWKVYGTPGKW